MAYFFASDIHLGYFDDPQQEAAHRGRFLDWLRMVEQQRGILYLMGDVFDFWFEYAKVIPKGYDEVLARLSEMSRNGIEIHFFRGNHDLWTRDYLEKTIGMTIHDGQLLLEAEGHRLLLGHGHKLPLDRGIAVRFMKRAFASRFLFHLFSALVHPDLMLRFGQWWSRSSRRKKTIGYAFRGAEEPIVRYLEQSPWEADFFVFGHLHTVACYAMKRKRATLILLGEWIEQPTYGVLENGTFAVHRFGNE